MHDAPDERATAAQLDRILRQYDVSPWCFTNAVNIDRDAIPHSHPILTIHARHTRDDALLLSTFLHEQTHWYLVAHRAQVDQAVAELALLVPDIAVGFPAGADSKVSSYEHLIVIALEERALQRLLGELAAHDVMEFWASDHYRALYRFVLDRRPAIWRVMQSHGLSSPAQR